MLNVGDNRLAPLDEAGGTALRGALLALRVLVASGTPLTWREAERLGAAAPGLEELHVAGCGLTALADAPAAWDGAAGAAVGVGAPGAYVDAAAFACLRVRGRQGSTGVRVGVAGALGVTRGGQVRGGGKG